MKELHAANEATGRVKVGLKMSAVGWGVDLCSQQRQCRKMGRMIAVMKMANKRSSMTMNAATVVPKLGLGR